MPKAAVIGVFDGVHRGHRHLLERLKAEAAVRGLEPVAITFSRHPLELVRPGGVPSALCPLGERLVRLRSEGVEPMVVDFTPELRAMRAVDFLRFLKQEGVELLLMGFNNRIGSDRLSGEQLQADAPIEIVIGAELSDVGVSSSAIRESISRGDMERAAEMLGAPYSLEGEVVKGRQIGRTLGFPTANIDVKTGMTMPPRGVYEARVGGRKAVVNIGRRPTLDNGNDVTVEVHIPGFDGDLYGQLLRVEFLRRLRPEKKFDSLDELKAQIQRDIESIRNGK